MYDGNGNLVKKIKPDGSKTIYVGGVYEVDKTSGGATTRTVSYYPVAGAMRINSTLYYILKDHLGSASVVTDSSGNVVGEQRYYPFGETRFTAGTIYTDRLFTGQQEMAGLGIYNYGARFYSPKLGRFLSADIIVPNPFNPQDLNRFSYVRNNPLRYTDPTGHVLTTGDAGDPGVSCKLKGTCPPPPPTNTPTPKPTNTPTNTPTPTITLTPTVTPTETVTPICADPSNNCATNIAGQATNSAYQTPTFTPTPDIYSTSTLFAENAVGTLVVKPVEVIVEYCSPPSDCGDTLIGGNTGKAIDIAINAPEFVTGVTDSMLEESQNITDEGATNAIIIFGIGVPTILIPLIVFFL